MQKGQWTGLFAGTNSGEVIAEFDAVGDRLVGTIAVHPSDARLPSALVPLSVSPAEDALDRTVGILPIDPVTGDGVKWPEIAGKYPDVTQMSATADTRWRLSPSGILYLSWTTDIGHFGTAQLRQASPTSHREPLKVTTWEEFKEYAAKLPPHRYIFRGQPVNLPLRTHFHRTGRSDLRRFVREDMQNLHRMLTGLTPHYFDMRDNIQYGAFNALIQHHGYPTPLLDWTFSPYVAAFFAYRNVKKSERNSTEKVRILMFDSQEWRNDFLQMSWYVGRRHFSLFAPLGISNTRLIPQQALSSICNVDDIEAYLAERESEKQKVYLAVIDLPKSERGKVISELGMMGITAGSMFPGLDGACEQLREQYFDY